MVTKPQDDRFIVLDAIDNNPSCIYFLFTLSLCLSLDLFPVLHFHIYSPFISLVSPPFFCNPCVLKIRCVLLLSHLYPSLLLFSSPDFLLLSLLS